MRGGQGGRQRRRDSEEDGRSQAGATDLWEKRLGEEERRRGRVKPEIPEIGAVSGSDEVRGGEGKVGPLAPTCAAACAPFLLARLLVV